VLLYALPCHLFSMFMLSCASAVHSRPMHFFFLCFFILLLFLKLQFMRIKMYMMSNCCVRACTWRCRARDYSACKHCVLHDRLSITTVVAYRTLAGCKMHGDWQLSAIIVSTLSPFVRPRPRRDIAYTRTASVVQTEEAAKFPHPANATEIVFCSVI